MKQLWVGIMATACAASLAAAQAPSQTTPTRSSSQGAANQVTVTGCIQKGAASSSSATGTTGTAGASSSAAPSFMLTNASSGSSSSSSATSATGTSGSATSYHLEGDDAKLTPHIGHKVEITGTLDAASSPSSSPSASSSSSAPKLKVDSIKMVASSCSE